MLYHHLRRWLFIALFLSPGNVTAQADFDAWKQSRGAAFNAYREAQERAFLEKLERDWQEFERFKAFQRDVAPKPPRQPEVRESLAAVEPELPVEPAPSLATPAGNFLGHKLQAPPWSPAIPALDRPSPQLIAEAYRRLLESDYQLVLNWLDERARLWQLGDWARYRLLQQVSDSWASDANGQLVLQWFLLLQGGYDVRLGYNQRDLVLLMAARERVFELGYYQLGGDIYYDVASADRERLQIYRQQRELAQPLVLAISQHPQTRPEVRERIITSRERTLTLRFDAQLSRFYNDYPHLELKHYFAAPLDPYIEASLRKGWQSLPIAKAGEQEQLNAMLELLQFGLPYLTDQEQFGREKYQLPELVMYHPASDCEDRAFLLAKMVSLLLKLPVVGLDYPGHVATGVAIAGEGDRWSHAGKSYLVADPTYLGADAGMSIPQVQGIKPEVIRF